MPAYPAPFATGPARPGAGGLMADTPIARAAEVALEVRSGGGRPWPRPRACRIMTIANQKGGVGKTTTAVNIAAALALHGSNVLVIDLDPQGNASTALDVDHRVGTPSVYNVLVEDRRWPRSSAPSKAYRGCSASPATIDLAGAEIELVPLVARESRLARAIAAYDASGLDYIIIDCPPSLGLLTVNSLVAAAEVLIPIQCEYYALEGLEQLLRTVDLVKGHLNADLVVSTILLTMYDARTRLAAQVADDVRSHFGAVVLGSVIPRSVRVSEAPSYGQSVMTYDPGSTGALAYLEAAKEIANQNLLDRPGDPVSRRRPAELAGSAGQPGMRHAGRGPAAGASCGGRPGSRHASAGRGGAAEPTPVMSSVRSVARPPGPWQDVSNRILGDAQGDASGSAETGAWQGTGSADPFCDPEVGGRSRRYRHGPGRPAGSQVAGAACPPGRPGGPAPGRRGARRLLRGDRDRRGHTESPPAQAGVR